MFESLKSFAVLYMIVLAIVTIALCSLKVPPMIGIPTPIFGIGLVLIGMAFLFGYITGYHKSKN